MKPLRPPANVWVLALAASLASLLISAHALPDRVATHFDFSGRANGWSSRTGNLVICALTAGLFTGIGLWLFPLFRFFKNVPEPSEAAAA